MEDLLINHPLGFSPLGFWFGIWYFLRDSTEVMLILESKSELPDFFKRLEEFRVSSVVSAAGVPYNLIFPWIKTDPTYDKIEHQRFRHDIERRQINISRTIERHLFPKILSREYEYQTFPRIILAS